jgi:hypothetical protein
MFLVIRNNVSVITKYLGGFVVEQDVEPNALKQVDRENDDEQDLKNKKKVNFHHFSISSHKL